MRSAQGKMLLGDDNGISRTSRGRISIKDHKNFETYLERYRGLLLYLKEMDESAYAKICAVSMHTMWILCNVLTCRLGLLLCG